MYHYGLMLGVLLLTASNVMAGRLYGTLQIGTKALAEGQPIYVVCPPTETFEATQTQPPAGVVKKYGRYSVVAPANGECTFAVSVTAEKTVSIPIISFKNPTRYNFVIRRHGHTFVISKKP